MSKQQNLLQFDRLYDRPQPSSPRLEQLISDGKIPSDILFRLLSIGEYQPDPKSPKDWRQPLYLTALHDAIDHADNPSEAHPLTQNIVWGELPNVVVDLGRNSIEHPESFEELSEVYWSMEQLAKVIQMRRQEEGKTITVEPRNSYYTADELEENKSYGLARPMWRTFINRLNPDVTKHPEWFYPSGFISFNNIYSLSLRTRARRALGRSLISNMALRGFYDEINAIGMKGIGPTGKKDLAVLLAPMHEDILFDLAEKEGVIV